MWFIKKLPKKKKKETAVKMWIISIVYVIKKINLFVRNFNAGVNTLMRI